MRYYKQLSLTTETGDSETSARGHDDTASSVSNTETIIAHSSGQEGAASETTATFSPGSWQPVTSDMLSTNVDSQTDSSTSSHSSPARSPVRHFASTLQHREDSPQSTSADAVPGPSRDALSGLCRDGNASASSSSTLNDSSAKPEFQRFRYNPSRIPVRGHSFCTCVDTTNRVEGRFLECLCGEEDASVCEWTWDNSKKSLAARIQDDNRTVVFHPNFSKGTAAVRGTVPMKAGQHFWEVKMITPVYGTNMMVGVGTKDIDLNSYSNMFCSLLGQNAESWGLSYQAHFHHAGQIWQYGSMFGQGSLIGVHLDCWHGALHYYKNRRPLGEACRNIVGKEVYPMLCSTAARSGMRLVRTQSCDSNLQYFCCRALRQIIPAHLDVMKVVPLPPGLKDYLSTNYGWLLSAVVEPIKPPLDEKEQNNPHSSDVDIENEGSEDGCTDDSTSYQFEAQESHNMKDSTPESSGWQNPAKTKAAAGHSLAESTGKENTDNESSFAYVTHPSSSKHGCPSCDLGEKPTKRVKLDTQQCSGEDTGGASNSRSHALPANFPDSSNIPYMFMKQPPNHRFRSQTETPASSDSENSILTFPSQCISNAILESTRVPLDMLGIPTGIDTSLMNQGLVGSLPVHRPNPSRNGSNSVDVTQPSSTSQSTVESQRPANTHFTQSGQPEVSNSTSLSDTSD